MFREPVVFVDIETSGSSYKSGRIIEIAAIRVENNEVTDVFKTLVNPGVRIPHWITELTGLADKDVTDAPSFEDIAYQLRQILDGAIFIAHNVHFDYSFVKNQLEGCGHSYDPNLLCTVRLSRALYPQHKGHSLQKIIERHGIEVSERHRAFDDAKALFDFLRLAYAEHGSSIFEAAISKQLRHERFRPACRSPVWIVL
jgi:DNA polymerase III subunit epsilon